MSQAALRIECKVIVPQNLYITPMYSFVKNNDQKISLPKEIRLQNYNNSLDARLCIKKVSIIYFYRTNCDFCKKLQLTIEKIKSVGVRVIPVQVDYKTQFPMIKNSIPYDQQMEAIFPIKETPTFILKISGKTSSLKGEISISQLYKSIKFKD